MGSEPTSPEEGARSAGADDARNAATPRRVASRDLFDGGRELVIAHGGRDYRLRITQNGKLILTA